MSKINRLRFCNVNYNNNTMKINDELFTLSGENTLFNLRNGGGKSVLVQMISAPFVHTRYRDTKDREFSSYFTSSTPSYILVEWKLDDNAGYLLTGMMVRKKDYSSDENSKEKLDIYNFIYKYKQRNPYDIENIPFIEADNSKKTVKTYNNSKKLFEKLKSDRDLKFNYYDMNNSATAKGYFDKIREYKIDSKEWESVIKKINLKESGLSELFTNSKNIEGLVKEWFLPNIVIKLNKENDRLKEYRSLINSYILTYKQNESSLDKKRKIELFNEETKVVYEGVSTYLETINNRKSKENQIANIIDVLDKKHEEIIKEIQKLEDEIDGIDNSISELGYEKLSVEIYRNQDELADLSLKESTQEQLKNKLKAQLEGLKRQKNIYACASIYKRYKEASTELQDIENKLLVLRQDKKDKTPRIDDLGFTIRGILNGELEQVKTLINEEEEKTGRFNNEKSSIEKTLGDYRNSLQNSKEKKGKLEESLKNFDKIEGKFNNNYKENLFRNIEKVYNNEFMLELEKKIENRIEEINKAISKLTKESLESNEQLKSKERQKESINNELVAVNINLERQNSKLMELNREIEKRKEILKFIEHPVEKLFDKEEIILKFQREIKLIKEDEGKLNKIKDELTKEVQKLETGKVLELSKEIEAALKAKDINIIYGMDWLKKNNKSAKENQEIVNNNPFIPYSLIMDNKDIELLSKEKIDVFTSNPISIINRDSLENLIVKKGSSIISEGNIKFLISFNNKLLNEEELRALTDELKIKITEVDVELEEKYVSLDLYEKKRNDIEYSSLSLDEYENTKSEIEILTDKVKELNETVAMLREEINNITIVINENRNNITNLKEENSKLANKRNDFKELKTEYAKYLNNLEDNRINIEKINVVQSKIQENIEREKVLVDSLEKSKETINQYKNSEKDTSKELVNFEQYKTGNLLKKDKEDLISEYGSLIKTITDTEAELKSKQVAATSKFKNEEEALIKKAKDYSLQENDYNKIVYSIDKESEIEAEIETNDGYLTKENKNLSDIVSKKAVSANSLDVKFKNLKSIYQLEVPKNKELLYEKDYDEEEAKLKVDKKTISIKSGKMNKLLSNIDTNRNSLSDYNDLVIVEILEIDLNYENLREDIGKVKRDLNNFKEKEGKDERKLNNHLRDIKDNDEFKEDLLFKEPLETLLSMVSNPKALLENLNIISGGYHNIINKLTLDIELIKKEEDTVIESLLEYIKEVHENIDKIDSNSSITIKEKSIKMLNIKVQGWEENREIYKLKLKEYIAEIRDQALINLNKNESIENIISNKINIEKLYDEVVSISSIEIKLYKIEEDKQRKISWDEVSKNSGGEGFLSAFVILSSLLSYMRRDDTDIFSSREDGKVLIMDNPFAQTSSAHLLKPLIEVARKSNTQLICLSDLRGDAILNRFDNIYVLNLISSKMHMGEKYLKGEHIKGNEDEVEVMSSSRFKIEEQIRLF